MPPPSTSTAAPPEKTALVTIGATAPFDALLHAVLNHTFIRILQNHGYTHLRIQHGGPSGTAIHEAFVRRYYSDSPSPSREEEEQEPTGNEDGEGEGDGKKRRSKIKITGFAFNKSGLESEMRALQPTTPLYPLPNPSSTTGTTNPTTGTSTTPSPSSPHQILQGLLISHAGSGSILDALRYHLPCIVVPNPDLLHNHQRELAEELARLGYVVHGSLENLGEALEGVDGRGGLRDRLRGWPPVNCGEEGVRSEVGVAERRGKDTRKRTGRGEGEIVRGDLGRVLDEEMGWVD